MFPRIQNTIFILFRPRRPRHRCRGPRPSLPTPSRLSEVCGRRRRLRRESDSRQRRFEGQFGLCRCQSHLHEGLLGGKIAGLDHFKISAATVFGDLEKMRPCCFPELKEGWMN
jgi:hypothetical protein